MLFLTWKQGLVWLQMHLWEKLLDIPFCFDALNLPLFILFYSSGNISLKQWHKSSLSLFVAPAARCCSCVGRVETGARSDAHSGICGGGNRAHQPLGSPPRCRDDGVVGQQLPPACLLSGPLPCFSIPPLPSEPCLSLCPGGCSPSRPLGPPKPSGVSSSVPAWGARSMPAVLAPLSRGGPCMSRPRAGFVAEEAAAVLCATCCQREGPGRSGGAGGGDAPCKHIPWGC